MCAWHASCSFSNVLQISARSNDAATSYLCRPTSRASLLITTTCNILNPPSLMRTQQTYPPKSRPLSQLSFERELAFSDVVSFATFSFPSGALHRRSGMEITGRKRLCGRTPHRLRMGSSTKCARRQCAPVDCRPNYAARRRALHGGGRKGTREWSRRLRLLSTNLANHLTEQPLAGCVKHKAAHSEGQRLVLCTWV